MKGPLPFELYVFVASMATMVLAIMAAYWGWFV